MEISSFYFMRDGHFVDIKQSEKPWDVLFVSLYAIENV